MAYQWSGFSDPANLFYFRLYATKPYPNEGNQVLSFETNWDGPAWSGEEAARVAGVLKDALEADGWTVAVTQRADATCSLEEAPEAP